jgi:purine catabolism regulator
VPVTVASLLSDRTLGLRVATTEAALDRPLSWVHVSELADPTPFLDGGELLLTTGLWLGSDAAVESYVGRLVDAGVAALGFGTGLGHAKLPAELMAAAEARGLALLEVPRGTPFIALSRRVAAALAAEEYAEVARSVAVQQELARAALSPDAPSAVLKRLGRAIGGWALLLDANGAVLGAAPGSASSRAETLRAELDQLRRTPPPASAALNGPDGTVLLQSLGAGGRTRGLLVVGSDDDVPPAQRYLVNAAAVVLTLLLEQSLPLDTATARVRAAVLELLADGRTGAAAAVLERLGEALPDEPVQVVAVLGEADERAAAGELAAEAAARLGVAVLRADAEGVLVLVAAADGPLPGQLMELFGRGRDQGAGSSEAVPWERFADGLRHAREAAELGARRGGTAVAFTDLAAGGLGALVDAHAARAFADALLAPLREADRTGRGDLVRSLRAWLAHHGQHEPAAAELGVHRHTLRNRVRRAGELLGRDLDAPDARAELWFALQVTSVDGSFPEAGLTETGQQPLRKLLSERIHT